MKLLQISFDFFFTESLLIIKKANPTREVYSHMTFSRYLHTWPLTPPLPLDRPSIQPITSSLIRTSSPIESNHNPPAFKTRSQPIPATRGSHRPPLPFSFLQFLPKTPVTPRHNANPRVRRLPGQKAHRAPNVRGRRLRRQHRRAQRPRRDHPRTMGAQYDGPASGGGIGQVLFAGGGESF